MSVNIINEDKSSVNRYSISLPICVHISDITNKKVQFNDMIDNDSR